MRVRWVSLLLDASLPYRSILGMMPVPMFGLSLCWLHIRANTQLHRTSNTAITWSQTAILLPLFSNNNNNNTITATGWHVFRFLAQPYGKYSMSSTHLKLHVIVTFYALFAFIYTTIVSSWLFTLGTFFVVLLLLLFGAVLFTLCGVGFCCCPLSNICEILWNLSFRFFLSLGFLVFMDFCVTLSSAPPPPPSPTTFFSRLGSSHF